MESLLKWSARLWISLNARCRGGVAPQRELPFTGSTTRSCGKLGLGGPGKERAVHVRGWYLVYGLDAKDGMPTWEQQLEHVHPDDSALWQATIDRAIAEKSDYDVEFRILPPDGSLRFIHSVAAPF